MYNPRVLGMSAGNVVQAPVDKLANELTQRLAPKPPPQSGMQAQAPGAPTQASNPSSMIAPLQGNSTSTTPTGGIPPLSTNQSGRSSLVLPAGTPTPQQPSASRWQGQEPPKQDMVSSGGGGWSQTNHAPNVTQSQTIAPVGGTVTPWQHPIVPYANSPSTVKPDQTGMESNNGALGQGGSSYGEPSGKGQQGHQKKQQSGGAQQQQQQGQQGGEGLVTASASVDPSTATYRVSIDGKSGESARPEGSSAQTHGITLNDGTPGWYDPVTHTTYKSDGKGGATVVVDKAGYSEDGTPDIGDPTDPANFYNALDGKGNPVRGPHGEQIFRNPKNGALFYYDPNGRGYVRVGPDGVEVDFKTGAPIQSAIAENNGKPAPANPIQGMVDYYNNNPPPQFNQQAIEDQINAAKQQRAIQGGQDSRSLMALAANSGTNPDAAQANLGQMSAESNAQGAASDAKIRMQGELTKLQQETKWYDDKANALRMMAAAETDKSNQAALFIQAQLAASAAASRQEAMMKMQIELSKPSVGEMIGGGFLGLLTGGLSGGLGRLIGGLGGD